jgi:hypothetical protein
MRIYISGPITGTADYEERFAEAASAIKADGHTYVNPAMLRRFISDINYDTCMAIDLEYLAKCDAICQLPGWVRSMGCKVEREAAIKHGLYFYDIKTGTFSGGPGRRMS